MKYKAGDKVRVVNNTNNPEIKEMNDMIGEVCEIQSENFGGYKVFNLEKDTIWNFREEDLAPAKKLGHEVEIVKES